MFKKLLIAGIAAGVNTMAGAATPPSTLVNDYDSTALSNIPGGSFDSKIELERKVQELIDLQMTPEQVYLLKKMMIDQQRNAASPYAVTAKPVTRSLALDLSPGSPPPTLRLSYNMLTTVVFTDISGGAWPIAKISLNRALFNDGNESGVSEQALQQQQNSLKADGENQQPVPTFTPSNILSLEPLTPTSYGNIAVTLQGLSTPIIFILTTAQGDVDMRVDARVPTVNPKNKMSYLGSNRISTQIDDVALQFVDGVAPSDAVSLKTNDNDVDAWILNNDLVVRTKASIIYPSFTNTVRSASGMSVFRFSAEHQSITISKGGKPVTIHFEH